MFVSIRSCVPAVLERQHELGAFLYMTKVFASAFTARRFLLGAAIIAALFTAPATAQIQGRVVDRSEQAVAGALVELWITSRRAAGARTDQHGRFELPSGPVEGQLMLTVRRIGMATQTVPLSSRDTTLLVTIEVQALALQPVTVAASAGRLCPRREEPQARALWSRMRTRYWQPGADSVFVFGFMEIRAGTGERTDVYEPEAGRTSAGWTTGALVIAYPEYMAHSGYALPAAGGVGERTAHWSYRALDDGMMQDFTGDYFGAVHTFSLLSQGAEETTIAFCPRDRLGRRGQIQGTLVLRADTTLSHARWTFHTPNPSEDAGGEASYHPPDPAFGRALLARETAYWRKSGPRAYYFEAKSFAGWRRWDRTSARRAAVQP